MMTLEEIANAIEHHGFDAKICGDHLRVYHGPVLLDSVSILEVFASGKSCFIESEEEGIRYGIDRKNGTLEMDQWRGVLDDRREMAEDGHVTIEVQEVDLPD
ncbi:MAG: hypothetical protein KC964_08830 [Candidatus Omnitrophica bacterium]|nr:hypothetical protein [Candidatus Omnitrophota bacterium]